MALIRILTGLFGIGKMLSVAIVSLWCVWVTVIQVLSVQDILLQTRLNLRTGQAAVERYII